MAVVEITCPHCNSIQKVPDHRLSEPTHCMKCQVLIEEPFQHKVAPAQVTLNVALKGKLVTDFGTTQLEEVESKADSYTGRKGTEVRKREDLQALAAISEFSSGSSGYVPAPRARVLSTAARTYITGGILILLVLIAVTIAGFMFMEEEKESKDIRGAAGSERIERHPNGAVQVKWSVKRLDTGEEVMDGAWEEFYAGGEKKALGQYSEGKEFGLWQTWHLDGRIASRGQYVNGLKDGLWEEFHANGVRAEKSEWVNGKQQGDTRRWYPNEQQESVKRYKDGLLDGDWSEWHENGEVRLSYSYQAGRKVGTWRRFHDNATQQFEERYVDGLPEGKTWSKYRNGQLEFEGSWKAGLQTDVWTWWYSNGNRSKSGTYIEGRQDGEWTEWYDNGQMRLRENYKLGVREGLWEEFWEDGSPAARREYKEGSAGPETVTFAGQEVLRRTDRDTAGNLKAQYLVLASAPETKHGPFKSFHPDGKTVAEQGDYVNGNREGYWRYFNAEGKQTVQKRFENGTEVAG